MALVCTVGGGGAGVGVGGGDSCAGRHPSRAVALYAGRSHAHGGEDAAVVFLVFSSFCCFAAGRGARVPRSCRLCPPPRGDGLSAVECVHVYRRKRKPVRVFHQPREPARRTGTNNPARTGVAASRATICAAGRATSRQTKTGENRTGCAVTMEAAVGAAAAAVAVATVTVTVTVAVEVVVAAAAAAGSGAAGDPGGICHVAGTARSRCHGGTAALGRSNPPTSASPDPARCCLKRRSAPGVPPSPTLPRLPCCPPPSSRSAVARSPPSPPA